MNIRQSVTIPTILKVGSGMLSHMGDILREKQIEHVVLFYGNDLIALFGDTVAASLKQAEIKILDQKELDSIHMEDVVKLAFEMDNKTQAVVGIGGGKVIDAAKYAAFLRKLPFISVPTSTSSDCRYGCHKKCTGEIYLFRHRRYGIKDHFTLRLAI